MRGDIVFRCIKIFIFDYLHLGLSRKMFPRQRLLVDMLSRELVAAGTHNNDTISTHILESKF